MCGGGNKGQSQTAQTQSYAPNPQAAGYINSALQQGANAAALPFNIPQAPVAGFSPQQQQAFNLTGQAVGTAQPYINQASNLFGQSAQAPNISNFFNPYAGAVTSQLNNIFGQQNVQNTGQLTQAAGGVGADRIAVGQANLANQQGLAAGQTLANLYAPSLSAAEQEQNIQQGAGYGLGALGPAAQAAQLQGANALLGTGGLQQQEAQAQLNAPYQQQLAAAAFPYQQANFYSNIVGSLAPGLGGTTSGYGTQTPAQPSILSQALGAGVAGAGIYGYGNSQGWWGGGSNGSPITGAQNVAMGQGYGAGYDQYGNPLPSYSARGGRIGYDDGGTVQMPTDPGVNLPPVTTDTYQRLMELQQLRGDAMSGGTGGNPYALPSGVNGTPINVSPQSEVPTGQIAAIHPTIPQLPQQQQQSGGSGGSLFSTLGTIAGSFIPGLGTAVGGAGGKLLDSATGIRRGGRIPHKDFGGSVSGGGGFPLSLPGIFMPNLGGSAGGTSAASAASTPAATPAVSPAQTSSPTSPVAASPAAAASTNPFAALFGATGGNKGSGFSLPGGQFYGGFADGGDIPDDDMAPSHREFLAHHGIETASPDLSPTATPADIKGEALGMVDPLGIPSAAAGYLSPELGQKLEGIKQASPEGYGAGSFLSPFNDIPAAAVSKGIGLASRAATAFPKTAAGLGAAGALAAGTAGAGDQPTGRPVMTTGDAERIKTLEDNIKKEEAAHAAFLKSPTYSKMPLSAKNDANATSTTKVKGFNDEISGIRQRLSDMQTAYDKAGQPLAIRDPDEVAKIRAGFMGLSGGTGLVSGLAHAPKSLLGLAGQTAKSMGTGLFEGAAGAYAPTMIDMFAPTDTDAFKTAHHNVWSPDYFKNVIAPELGYNTVLAGAGHLVGAAGREGISAANDAVRSLFRRTPAAAAEAPAAAQAAIAPAKAASALNLTRFVDKNGNVHWRDERGYRRKPPANLAPGNTMPAESQGGAVNPFSPDQAYAEGGSPYDRLPLSTHIEDRRHIRRDTTPDRQMMNRLRLDQAVDQQASSADDRVIGNQGFADGGSPTFNDLWESNAGIDNPVMSPLTESWNAARPGSSLAYTPPADPSVADVRLNEDTLGIGPNRGYEDKRPIDTILNDQAVARAGLSAPGASARSPYAPPQTPTSAAPTGGAPASTKDPGFIGSPWAALTAAGLGMMAGTSPWAGVNIGRGAMQGLQELQTQRAAAQKDTTIEQASRRLDLEAKQHEDQYTRSTPYQQFEMSKPFPTGQRLDFSAGFPQTVTTYGRLGPNGEVIPVEMPGSPGAPNATPAPAPAKPAGTQVAGDNAAPVHVPAPAPIAGYSSDALDILGRRLSNGDATALANLGYGRPAMAVRAAIQNHATNVLMTEGGMSPGDAAKYLTNEIQLVHAQGLGLGQESRTAAIRAANLDIVLRATNAAVPAALEASEAVARTGWVPLNKIIQAGQVAASDPKLKAFGMANLQLAEHWARAMNPTGQMRESDRDLALNYLGTFDSKETYQTAVRQLQVQIARERTAVGENKPSTYDTAVKELSPKPGVAAPPPSGAGGIHDVAADWARAHPDSPQAKKILQNLGIQ